MVTEAGIPPPTGGQQEGERLRQLYARRFDPDEEFRIAMWGVLCEDFFNRYVGADDTVLEIAAGHCEFINQIRGRRRIALDLNPDVRRHAAPGVEVIVGDATDVSEVADGSVSVAFVSNFFEHVPREVTVACLREVRRVLDPERGRLLVLQPNIRFCAKDYWMFFDHVTPLDDRSLTEALHLAGFGVEEMIVRFLPYTTKSRLPRSPALVRAYLRLRPAWRLFGAQSLAVARPS